LTYLRPHIRVSTQRQRLPPIKGCSDEPWSEDSATETGVYVDGKRLLLVEDEFLIRLLLADSLTEAGFEVVEAEDGDEAVQMLDRLDGLDLLLTDIQMPGQVDGNAVAAKAKELYPGIPVIYVSGRPESLKNKVGRCDVFVHKPYGPAAITRIVKRLLGMG
jgi:CheY-like chemotaxis protein